MLFVEIVVSREANIACTDGELVAEATCAQDFFRCRLFDRVAGIFKAKQLPVLEGLLFEAFEKFWEIVAAFVEHDLDGELHIGFYETTPGQQSWPPPP